MDVKLSSILSFMLVAVVSCGVSKGIKIDKSYTFTDQPKRNLELIFRGDNTFTLVNRVKGSLMFSVVGNWEKLSEGKFLLSRSADCPREELPKAAAKGEPINTSSAYYDK